MNTISICESETYYFNKNSKNVNLSDNKENTVNKKLNNKKKNLYENVYIKKNNKLKSRKKNISKNIDINKSTNYSKDYCNKYN